MRFKNLVIIGTSHIARQSLDDVRSVIASEKPEIIALELDRNRAHALLTGQKAKPGFAELRRFGVKGFLFGILAAWAEKKLGSLVGVAPGSEMLLALKIAHESHIGIAYIDQDISLTLRRLSAAITWKEKWYFVADIFKAVVLRENELGFDMSKVPSGQIIRRLMEKFRKRYPSLYHVLVVERNIHMANRLESIISSNPDLKVVAIVGAGHEDDVGRIVGNRLVRGSARTLRG